MSRLRATISSSSAAISSLMSAFLGSKAEDAKLQEDCLRLPKIDPTAPPISLSAVVENLIATEVSYVTKVLDPLVHVFYKTTFTAQVLDEQDEEAIFGNIEELYQVNTKFLEKLKNGWFRRESTPIVAAATIAELQEVIPTFRVYSEFLGQYRESEGRLERLLKKNKKFDKLTNENSAVTGFALQTLLDIPNQRFAQYEIYFAEIARLYRPDNRIENELGSVAKLWKATDAWVNDSIRVFMARNTVVKLELAFFHKTVDLAESHRLFIKQGAIKRIPEAGSRRNKQVLLMILMTDIIALATQQGVLKKVLWLPKCEVQNSDPIGKSQHVFKVLSERGLNIFAAPTEDDKKSWISDIQKAITETKYEKYYEVKEETVEQVILKKKAKITLLESLTEEERAAITAEAEAAAVDLNAEDGTDPNASGSTDGSGYTYDPATYGYEAYGYDAASGYDAAAYYGYDQQYYDPSQYYAPPEAGAESDGSTLSSAAVSRESSLITSSSGGPPVEIVASIPLPDDKGRSESVAPIDVPEVDYLAESFSAYSHLGFGKKGPLIPSDFASKGLETVSEESLSKTQSTEKRVLPPLPPIPKGPSAPVEPPKVIGRPVSSIPVKKPLPPGARPRKSDFSAEGPESLASEMAVEDDISETQSVKEPPKEKSEGGTRLKSAPELPKVSSTASLESVGKGPTVAAPAPGPGGPAPASTPGGVVPEASVPKRAIVGGVPSLAAIPPPPPASAFAAAATKARAVPLPPVPVRAPGGPPGAAGTSLAGPPPIPIGVPPPGAFIPPSGAATASGPPGSLAPGSLPAIAPGAPGVPPRKGPLPGAIRLPLPPPGVRPGGLPPLPLRGGPVPSGGAPPGVAPSKSYKPLKAGPEGIIPPIPPPRASAFAKARAAAGFKQDSFYKKGKTKEELERKREESGVLKEVPFRFSRNVTMAILEDAGGLNEARLAIAKAIEEENEDDIKSEKGTTEPVSTFRRFSKKVEDVITNAHFDDMDDDEEGGKDEEM